MQCGGIWGTRLDPQVSLGAGLGGAVLVVSPRGMRRKGPGKTSPSQLFWTKKWPYGPPREFHTVGRSNASGGLELLLKSHRENVWGDLSRSPMSSAQSGKQ